MNQINLSYVITTRNKLPYLKEVMKRLIDNLQEDEEIIVIDGASTDGTVEYLTDLHQQGKIQQFISESDRGEAHGYNKGFLMARGELIKDITDDDAYYYPAIQECKKFMLEHEEIDVMSGNVANTELDENGIDTIYKVHIWQSNFEEWFNTQKSVCFNGLPLMIRKSSLALTGLYCTNVKLVDTEFTTRITHLNVNISWNTALISSRIGNPQSNYRNMNNYQRNNELKKISYFYQKKYKKNWAIKDLIKSLRKLIRVIKNYFFFLLSLNKKIFNFLLKTQQNEIISTDEASFLALIENAFDLSEKFMKEYNSKQPTGIIYKTSDVNQK